MDNENLNPQEPELINDVISKPAQPEQSDAASAKAKEDAWLEEFFRDFSLPEDVATPPPTVKEQILKDRWETAPIPTAQIPELPNDMVYEEDPQSQTGDSSQSRPLRDKSRGLWGMLHSIPHLLSSCIWLALIVVIGVSLGRTLWTCAADLLAFGKDDATVTITITEQEAKRAPDGTLIHVDIDAIANKLHEAGLVDNPSLFVKFATLTGKDKDIAAGTYTLNTYFDYNAIINGLSYSPASREVVTVMIPEGYTCAQIFAELAQKEVCPVAELEKYAANGELKEFWFLEGVTRGDKYCLEGFLFPDTYEFYVNDDPQRVIEKFLTNFDNRFTDLMKEDFQEMQDRYAKMLSSHGYGSEYIESHKLTIHQLITLASIVEKESGDGAESFDIASVFYNRLTNAKEFPYLDADATVHYAIGDYFGEIRELTKEHLATNSPYNTRGIQKGLPPGPIANPGIYSLYAVLDPNDTKYHYYVLDPDKGTHVFAATYSEHQNNLKKLGY